MNENIRLKILLLSFQFFFCDCSYEDFCSCLPIMSSSPKRAGSSSSTGLPLPGVSPRNATSPTSSPGKHGLSSQPSFQMSMMLPTSPSKRSNSPLASASSSVNAALSPRHTTSPHRGSLYNGSITTSPRNANSPRNNNNQHLRNGEGSNHRSRRFKVLCTGGLGYIGSHTAVRLLETGYEVALCDNLSNSSIEVRVEDRHHHY
jgi:hypothetical protein